MHYIYMYITLVNLQNAHVYKSLLGLGVFFVVLPSTEHVWHSTEHELMGESRSAEL